MNLSLSCEADGAEGDNYSLGPELEGADKKQNQEAQIHNHQYTPEGSESVLPCSGALKNSPLEEAGKFTRMEKLNERLDGVCVDNVLSDIIDNRREFSSAGYEDNIAPQHTAMSLDGQSDQHNLTEMCRGDMDHTKSDSWNYSEDESRKQSDAFSPNVHLLFSCLSEQADARNTITQEDSGKVDSLIKAIVAAPSEATQDGVTLDACPLAPSGATKVDSLKARLCHEGESMQSPGLVQENSESMEIELTSYETALFMGDNNFGYKSGTLDYQTSEMNLMTCNIDVSQNKEDQIDTEQLESGDIYEQGCDSSEITLPTSVVCDKADSEHQRDDVPTGDFFEYCQAKH